MFKNLFSYDTDQAPVMREYVDVIGVTTLESGPTAIIQEGYISTREWKDCPQTIVLYTVDGVLHTKAFPGIWSLAQVKHWKALTELT